MPGLVAATLGPLFGWRAFLLVGGLMPLLVAVAGMVVLSESPKFLAGCRGRDAALRRAVREIRPDLRIESGTAIILAAMGPARRGSMRALFTGDFALVTPLLWLCQAANQMANFFALTWLPTLLQAGGAGAAHGGATASLFALGGLISGIVLLLLLDRIGVVPVLILFAVGAPLVAAMALPGLSSSLHAVVILGAGVCVTGVQIGLTALLGIFYPTSIRSSGVGWTQAAGRVGALAAPLVGGLLLSLDAPMSSLPLAPSALMVLGTLGCAVLVWRCRRRFGGFAPAEFSPATLPEAPLRQAEYLAS